MRLAPKEQDRPDLLITGKAFAFTKGTVLNRVLIYTMNNYTLALIHIKGWYDAAGSRPMNPAYADNDDRATKTVYEEGYVLGQADRRRISDYTAAKFQVTFGEIKAA